MRICLVNCIYTPKNNKIGWLKYTHKNLPYITLGDSHVFSEVDPYA
jgi:hypothetical protein